MFELDLIEQTSGNGKKHPFLKFELRAPFSFANFIKFLDQVSVMKPFTHFPGKPKIRAKLGSVVQDIEITK